MRESFLVDDDYNSAVIQGTQDRPDCPTRDFNNLSGAEVHFNGLLTIYIGEQAIRKREAVSDLLRSFG
jgi:hypothetical protein